MSAPEHYCYLCGSALSSAFTATDYITGDIFLIYRCMVCSLRQTLPHLTTEELAPYYAGVYYKQRKSFTDNHINRVRLRHIEHARTYADLGRTIVDIGCGNGALVEMLLARGWDAQGTEMAPPEHFVSEAVQHHVHIGEFSHLVFPPDTFDTATLWHVLEHVSDPRVYLKALHKAEKQDGLLVIEVPNIDSWQARLTKRNWFNLDVPRHVFHFTPESVTKILTEEGFRITRLSHYSAVYSFYGWVQSMLNLVTRRNNILFDALNKKITVHNYAAHGIAWWELLITALLVFPCALLSAPLTLAESVCKKGGIITIYARNTNIH